MGLELSWEESCDNLKMTLKWQKLSLFDIIQLFKRYSIYSHNKSEKIAWRHKMCFTSNLEMQATGIISQF